MDYHAAVKEIKARITLEPAFGLVLGSGLGKLADTLEDRVVIPYAEIPGWPQSTVEGHEGNLVVGKLEGKAVIAQQGRAHFYEGYTPAQVTFPVRVMKLLGAHTLILTNAAGGLNTDYRVGELMMLNDHIFLPGMIGNNPLMGPNDPAFGPRFPSLTRAYDRDLRRLAVRIAEENDILLHAGVYVCLSGPTYETPAEIRMLRTLGGDAVGMSTAHEVVVARHAGMRVFACSGITNVAIDSPDTDVETNHEEVIEAGKTIVPKLTTILKGMLKAL
jgi:purine-nucleoside phosphorylase